MYPVAGRLRFMTSSRTHRTEADERLPVLRRQSQESCRSFRCSPSASWVASRTLGPPVCMIHEPISCRVRLVPAEERVNVLAEILADDFGNAGREDDLKALLRNVPAHHVFRIRIERGRSVDDFGAGLLTIRTGYQDRRSAVAEKSGGNQVGDREILLLQRERAEFDRHQSGDVSGKPANVIGGSRDARRARDAAESEDWDALDVGRELHAIDEFSVNRRAAHAGDRNEEDGVDVACGQVRHASARGTGPGFPVPQRPASRRG